MPFLGGQVQASPLPGAPTAGIPGGAHLGKRALGQPLDVLLYLLLRSAGALAGDTHGLLALLQEEAGLVHAEDAGLLVCEVLEDVLPEVVADLVGVPPRRAQEALDALRVLLPDGLGHQPAVLTLHSAKSRPTR